ncbi:a10aff57-f416-409a-8d36-b8a310a55a3d [Thermothielavioides terrestris]|nr:a10aff57-f416-409a-8d36-b8a310a55a3d [Thermothielavioides terrestris]
MAATQPELYDLLVVTDATASMYTFLRSLHSSLQDIIRVSALTACFSRVGVLAYRDYDQSENVTQWSGWYSSDGPSEISQDELLSFVAQLQPIGGDDWREATRSGLAHAYQVMRPDARTIIVIFADAPPHTELASHEWAVEQQALAQPDSYGGAGKLFADWTSVARTLTRGEKRAHVFSIIEADRNYFCETTSMFTYLSTQSGGVCLSIPPNSTSETISKLTVCLLLSWMGAAKQGAKLDTQPLAAQARYADAGDIDQFSSEKDASAVRYLPVSSRKADRDALRANMTRSLLSLDTLAHVVPRREHAIMDFARRYKADPGYQAFVIEQLADIIQSDVAAIALNPVFGTLWRTVCNDRLQPARDKLIASFSRQLDAVEDRAKKDRLKKWLEESYDWAGEILETINSVPEEERYPCVFLDPTVRFPRAEGGEDGVNGDGANNSMEFTRDELLEIGRSCDNRILRRLGRILTRLTYVASKEELPAHIKDVPEDEVPRIPMALAKPEHHAKFWKVLLHTVLPGTMLAPRPAALLAALAVRMAIQPLEDVAYTELMAWREKWNTLDIPETWNSSCLGLLLEADKKHQQRVAGQQPGASSDGQSILKPEDRRLFEALVDYKLLEMNMDTTL